jgi:hypothetical protein
VPLIGVGERGERRGHCCPFSLRRVFRLFSFPRQDALGY